MRNCYAEYHGSTTNGLVANTGSQTDRRTDVILESDFPLLLRKEHLQKEKLSKDIRSRQKNENEDVEWHRCSGATT
jgi:hypothetical protein